MECERVNTEGARWQGRGRDDDFPWCRWLALLVLVCISGVPLYREGGDLPEAAFATGVFMAPLLLVGAFAAIDRAPPEVVGDARRRRRLRVAVWALGMMLGFACSYHVKTTMSPAVSLVSWCMGAIVTYGVAVGRYGPEACEGESPDESGHKESV